MVVITSGETLAKRKDDVWKALDAQNQAIDLLQKQPAQASKLIASYFIAEPTLKTLTRGELPRETVIAEAISTQVFTPADRQGHAPHAGDRRHPAGPGFAQDARRQAV